MKAWVTGATGLVGGALVDQLLARGDDVTALVRSESLSKTGVFGDRVRIVIGAIPDDVGGLRDAPAPDVIFHAAAIVARGRPASHAEYHAVHVEGTRRLADLAMRHGARLVHVSTISVYGCQRSPYAVDASTACRPTDVYGATKLAAEDALVVRGARGLDFAVLRPPAIYGERSRGDVIRSMAESIARGDALVVGDAPISVLYAGNLAAAMILLAERPLPARRIFPIADGAPCTRIELAALVGRALGRTPRFAARSKLRALVRRTLLPRAFPFIVDDGLAALGFAPPYALEDAITRALSR